MKSPSIQRVTPTEFRSLMDYGHAFLKSAADYGTEQKPGPTFIGLE
jgi:hypothetical protein